MNYWTVLLLLLPGLTHQQCPNSCLHGGTCWGDHCRCSDGWTGPSCQRPCQDIFKSCERWKEEGRCEWDSTGYFVEHCPKSCDTCVFDSSTVIDLPLAPLLEPLRSFIGTWRTESQSPKHFPTDFSSGGYDEELNITVAEAPAFDRPTLNYSARAISKLDSNDILSEVGFVYFKTDSVGLVSTGNSGLMVIQEGKFDRNTISLNTTFIADFPDKSKTLEADEARFLEQSGDTLTQRIIRKNASFSNVYRKVQ